MEFVSPDPNALVRAANVQATLDAFHLVPSAGRLLLQKHDLVLADDFVLVQRWLNALKELGKDNPQMLRRVGTAIIEHADFPPSLSTVEAVLTSLDKIYYMNHKGNVGHYVTSVSSNGTVLVRCETPYPRHFEWGLIEGICRNRGVAARPHLVNFREGTRGSSVTCELEVVPPTVQRGGSDKHKL